MKIALLVSLLILFSCQQKKRIISTLDGQTMGTTWSVKYAAVENQVLKQNLEKDIQKHLELLNNAMSTYVTSSEIGQFNKAPANFMFKASDHLFQVTHNALRIAQKTAGAFDPTLGPIIKLWGFSGGKERRVPSKEEIQSTMEKVGYQKLKLSESDKTLTKLVAGLSLNLSASAKGYAVDQVAEILEKANIKDYLVEIGGEMSISGQKPDSPWRVAIESPMEDSRSIHKILKPRNGGLATSGNYRNFFKENGIKYSHTIDHHTGRPVRHYLASVTVFHTGGCELADAWATALMALGPEKGFEVAKKEKLLAYFIVKNPENEEFEIHQTAGFESLFVEGK